MENEMLETNEKLEQIEANALENTDESVEPTESVNEPSMEMSNCMCMGSCGSNYSVSTNCMCMGSCGSNYHK